MCGCRLLDVGALRDPNCACAHVFVLCILGRPIILVWLVTFPGFWLLSPCTEVFRLYFQGLLLGCINKGAAAS